MDSFLLSRSLNVVDVQNIPGRLIVTVQDTREYVCCPSCKQPSRWIYSHCLRVTQDTAVGDRAVEVHLYGRRLRCNTGTCSHLTFAGTWPAWLAARVQRTSRLTLVQRSVALALGGEVGKGMLALLHDGGYGRAEPEWASIRRGFDHHEDLGHSRQPPGRKHLYSRPGTRLHPGRDEGDHQH